MRWFVNNSSLNRTLRTENKRVVRGVIQTDAAINPGNSGGPLLNRRGELVGITTAIVSRAGQSSGVGLAIPSSMARKVAESIIRDGKVIRGYLGVRIQELTAALARKLELPGPRGALVVGVQPGSPAEQAGLQVGDVIVKIGDREIRDAASLKRTTAELAIGLKTAVAYYREGKLRDAEVTIAELPAQLERR